MFTGWSRLVAACNGRIGGSRRFRGGGTDPATTKDACRSGRVRHRDAEGRRHKGLDETHKQRLQDHDGRPGEYGGEELRHLTPRYDKSASREE
ncbi:hypothetical protein GCM10027612_46310 [Microbispora bryophytorum subsp. camponoti]